jgi:SAM-dependent methyltransferase
MLAVMPRSTDRFEPHYLKYLAQLGSTNLHAAAATATEKLRSALALEPGMRVLDIGCGTGSTMLKFAVECPVIIDGVDFLGEMLRVAGVRLRVARLRNQLIQADATMGLPFRDESYDAVFTESVLGIHSPANADVFLTEVCRVLKVGGRFVANEGVWKAGTPAETVSAINRACVEDFGFSLASSAGWSEKDWAACIRCAGLTIVSTEAIDLHHSVPGGFSSIGFLSRMVTLAFRLKATLNPRMFGLQRRYRKLLERHGDDHHHIEAKLFVARKE